jgi:hypothetical protein
MQYSSHWIFTLIFPLRVIPSCSLLTIYDMLFSGGERHAQAKVIAGRRSREFGYGLEAGQN